MTVSPGFFFNIGSAAHVAVERPGSSLKSQTAETTFHSFDVLKPVRRESFTAPLFRALGFAPIIRGRHYTSKILLRADQSAHAIATNRKPVARSRNLIISRFSARNKKQKGKKKNRLQGLNYRVILHVFSQRNVVSGDAETRRHFSAGAAFMPHEKREMSWKLGSSLRYINQRPRCHDVPSRLRGIPPYVVCLIRLQKTKKEGNATT